MSNTTAADFLREHALLRDQLSYTLRGGNVHPAPPREWEHARNVNAPGPLLHNPPPGHKG